MKHLKRLTSLLLVFILLAACLPLATQAASANYDEYYAELIAKGFPDSYASRLADLHISRPTWTFEPVLVTKLKPTYTWSYVIQKELEDEASNLIDAASEYAPYHKNHNTYDSLDKYPCNKATVQFFMDPRNFMTEERIFMFQDLAYVPGTYSEAVVNAAFAGTFMENAVIPDPGNTLTYAQYLLQVGEKHGVSPTFLAARLRQEKGTNGNTEPLLNGSCGETLWKYYKDHLNGAPSSGYSYSYFAKFNGYYNYFNIDAMGEGRFEIYHNAMKEAYNASWDTHKEAIDGGAAKVRTKYINDYQNTSYFQKFNVDPRSSRNFWGQYMQTIYAVTSEGTTVYNASNKNGILDSPFNFIIPVFDGMSSSPYPNPGSQFGMKYSFVNMLDTPNPDGASPVTLGTRHTSMSIDFGSTNIANIGGWSVHSYARKGYYYSVDGGPWQSAKNHLRNDVSNAFTSYTNSPYNAFDIAVDMSLYGLGTHTVNIRGVNSNGTAYPIASVNVTCTAKDLAMESNEFKIGTTQSGRTIMGIDKNTTISDLLSGIDGGSRIVDENGSPVLSGTLKTGYKVQYLAYNAVVDSATIIVGGDVDCDGKITAKDVIRAKKYFASMGSAQYPEAIDCNNDGSISSNDVGNIANSVIS